MNTTKSGQDRNEQGAKVFTVQGANSALVLVRRIVQDIVTHFREMTRLRAELAAETQKAGVEAKIDAYRDLIEVHVDALGSLEEELARVGCVLKDWTEGLVDFPAEHQGKAVWLCWKLGEPAVTHWHEAESGFAGRRPIGPDFT